MLRRQHRSPEERRQTAFDFAWANLQLDDGRQAGNVDGGPPIKRESCLALVEEGQAAGLKPTPGFLEKYIESWNAVMAAGINPFDWDRMN